MRLNPWRCYWESANEACLTGVIMRASELRTGGVAPTPTCYARLHSARIAHGGTTHGTRHDVTQSEPRCGGAAVHAWGQRCAHLLYSCI